MIEVIVMRNILLFLNLMFSLNKNLFFERLSFLKSKSAKRNTIGYGIWFILKEHILSWVCLFLLIRIMNHEGLAFCLLCALLFVKLLRIDNIDWKLYFRKDFCLACPEPKNRFLTVLGGNLVKALLFEDFTPLYLVAFCLFTPVNIITALALYGFFVVLFIFVLTYYFLLETGSLGIKKAYSFLSYVFSMVSTFLIIYLLLSVIISLVGSIDFTVFKENPMQIMDTVTADLLHVANLVTTALAACEAWLPVFLVVASILLLTPVAYILLRRQSEPAICDDNALLFPKILVKHQNIVCKSPVQKALYVKEVQLFSYLYRFNFKQYWFAIFFDRSVATLLAAWLALYQYAIDNSGLIFFCLSLIMMSLDISSQVGVKMITNLSFISDFNTLRLANCNGLNLRELVQAKLRFFYSIRLAPTICTCIITGICLLTLNAPVYAIILMAGACVLGLLVYPSVYLTNNLINTKMDYRDYEKYLEESKLLDSGVEDFMPLSLTYNTKIVLLLACVIVAILLPDVSWLYLAVTAALLLLSLADHLIMKRILSNILLFIQGGDYSADIKKIFRKPNSSR